MDVIALTERMPDTWSMVAGLLAGGPGLRVQAVGAGGDVGAVGDVGAGGAGRGVGQVGEEAVLQLCDDSGRPLVSIEAPVLVRVPGEAARLLGPDCAAAPTPAWWVEARASTAVKDAERLAGAFAGRLAALLGGTVWPPRAAARAGSGAPVAMGVTAVPAPAAASPAVDVLTDKVAVVLQDRPVVAMTAWLCDALRAALASDRGLQIVTPKHTRLSLPTRSLLCGPPSRWVVRDGDGGHYDGLSGAVLRWGDGAFEPVGGTADGTAVADAFTEVRAKGERQLALSFRTLLPADERLVLGGALEAAWRRLTGGPPVGWGTAEPVALPWSRRRLTEPARGRAPGRTWFVVLGAEERPAIATARVIRTTRGVEEDVTLTVGLGPREAPPLGELPGIAHELVARYGLRSMLAQQRSARRDLTVPARMESPPVPVAFALGAEAVADIGLTRAGRPPLPDRPLELGAPRRPGFFYPLGDGSSASGWTGLERLMRHLQRPIPAPRSGVETDSVDP
ncbi:hypothetical protein GCM10012280_32390 [Wenjunlia tyrosinilytica]|uniref:Uncharacterized protein n=2 Tax=Wenjunlia tyrosinilytica TaxID=1544741 RepID=A0A917ZR81_9ACTN|nr:hypothetical protein GCM10012280_32390 [Wenjunlia tyrosinilytica]